MRARTIVLGLHPRPQVTLTANSFEHRRHDGLRRVQHESRAAASRLGSPVWANYVDAGLSTAEFAELYSDVTVRIRRYCVHIDWRRKSSEFFNGQGALGHHNGLGTLGCPDDQVVRISGQQKLPPSPHQSKADSPCLLA